MTPEDATRMGLDLLRLAGYKDWRVEWSKAAPSECWEDSKLLMMWDGILGNPWWYIKESLLHEIAHIGTGKPTDLAEQRHGPEFFRYLGLLAIHFAEFTPDNSDYRASGEVECKGCGKLYREHPWDEEQLSGLDGEPFLRIVCTGRRVKL